jgi:hypothetical protein
MNTFGSAQLQFPLCDPRSAVEDRARFRRGAIGLLERVNSFYCPIGRWPFRGWVLLPRSEYDRLDRYSTALQLNLGPGDPSDLQTLKNLSIVQAQCVTRGLASDPNALYLVELTDARGILWNKWFQFPTTSFYNIRAPAYPQTFHPASMNSGVPVTTTWTWSTMLQNLWEQMGALLGAWPGLPVTPVGRPEGYWFPGVPAWPALCDVLDHLGLAVACDLTQSAPYTIVSGGAADAAFSALQVKYAGNLEDDLEWIDVGAARVPKTITVLFRRRNSVYGTEETVRYDSPWQWDMTPFYTVSVTAPTAFASAVGSHYLWSDFTVRYDMDSAPFADDASLAGSIAQDRVTEYFDRIYSRTAGAMSQTYAGALPFATGAQVDGVRWYMDQDRAAWRTQVVRGASPPWPGLWDRDDGAL